MERKALGSVQKGWGAFSLSHHHQWDKEDESCSVYVLFPMVHPALKGAWRNGYGFESPLYALVQCPVETLLGKIVMCKGRPLPRELIRHCWLNLFFGLTSSLKKTKGASTSHRCPQTGDRLQWNKRPVVSIWGDLSNSTRSWKGVHLQYEERDVMDFSFPENEVQTRVGQCPPTPLHQIPPAPIIFPMLGKVWMMCC